MKTKQDFAAIIDQTAEKYDQIAALRRAGDPRYFQHQEAMATMFAMLSQQLEIGMMEPFDKVRDATVLADAALKGIIPKGSPARVKVLVKNASKTGDFTMDAGRIVTDSDSTPYVVDRPVIIPRAASDTEPGKGFVELVQRKVKKITHTVNASSPFYAVEIPESTEGAYLASIDIASPDGTAFRYTPGFTNVRPGDKVYHVETDEYRRVWVKFGIDGIAGYQPVAGEVLEIFVAETNGNVLPGKGSPFSLEYAYTPTESLITIEMVELMIAGSDPLGIPALRELSRYPSIYNESAVYLGEFDFLVRRTITNLPFLSVWNEQVEEQARGPSVDNINRLFVSFCEPVNSSKAFVEGEIRRVLLGADDSFDVVFVSPVVSNINLHIQAQIARVHDMAAVRAQIITAILSEYGSESPLSLQGMLVLQYKRVYDYLRSKIPALQDAGSDFSVTITNPPTKTLPEHWRYVSPTSLVVDVRSADYNIGGWGR